MSAGSKAGLGVVDPLGDFSDYWRIDQTDFTSEDSVAYRAARSDSFRIYSRCLGSDVRHGRHHLLGPPELNEVSSFAYDHSSESIFYVASSPGEFNTGIFRYMIHDGLIRTVLPPAFGKRVVSKGCISPDGRFLLYVSNQASKDWMEVFLRDVDTGAEVCPFPLESVWRRPTWNIEGSSFFASQRRCDSTVWRTWVFSVKNGRAKELFSNHGDCSVVPVSWDSDGTGLYLITNEAREYSVLAHMSLSRSAPNVVFETDAEVEAAAYSPSTGGLMAVVNRDCFSEVYYRQGSSSFVPVSVPKGALCPAHGYWNPVMSPNGSKAVTTWDMGTEPTRIVVIDLDRAIGHALRGDRTLADSVLGHTTIGVERVTLSSGDNVSIIEYLPTPLPSHPIPAVLSIHGGPGLQERPCWAFTGLYALLNSRGIAVVCPNLVGSTGQGRSYEDKLNGDWGGLDLHFLKEIYRWLSNREYIDASRLGVFGVSYGGYLALMSMADDSLAWKVGVDVCGPLDLRAMSSGYSKSWRPFVEKWIGLHERGVESAFQRSPVSKFDRIRNELLVVHGFKDKIVDAQQVDELVGNLQRRGVPVTCLKYPNEGHIFGDSILTSVHGEIAGFLIRTLCNSRPPLDPASRLPKKTADVRRCTEA